VRDVVSGKASFSRRMGIERRMDNKGIQDRVAGVLAGLAAGDRNGGPIQLAVRLAESLAAMGVFDRADVGDRYLSWWRNGAFDTGPITGRVLGLVAEGSTFDEAAAHVDLEMCGQTAGCNPAHRCAPLAMAPFFDNRELELAALSEASLTHAHPIAGDASAAVAMLCGAMIRGEVWESALERAGKGRSAEVRRALAVTVPAGQGGYSPVALGSAIFFIGTSSSLADALSRSIAYAGSANYCPVLVGAIGGARWGITQIPDRLLPSGRLRERVESVTTAMANLW